MRLDFGRGTTALKADRQGERNFPLRIYRKEEPEYRFNLDYAEFFDGIGFADAELIFAGELELIHKRMHVYIDEQIEVGKVYAYWVAAQDETVATGPVFVKVRDTEIWWPQARTEREIDRLAEAYPHLVTVRTFGHTVRHRPIRGLLIGNPHNRAAFVGVVHAGEAGPELLMPIVGRLLREEPELLKGAGLAIIPSVNIDQREKQVEGYPPYLRKNANGVDINRNFPANWETIEYTWGLDTSNPSSDTYRGVFPVSEPETQALISFIEETKPRGIFNYHHLASIVGDLFVSSRFAAEDEAYAAKCRPMAEAYTRGYAHGEEWKVKLLWITTAGSFPSWGYLRHGVPAFDLEWEERESYRGSLIDHTTREMLAECRERHHFGIRELLLYLRDNPAAGARSGEGE